MLTVRRDAHALQNPVRCLLRDLIGAVSGDTEAVL